MNLLLAPLYLVFAFISPAHADCSCSCVNGEMTPICDSAAEMPPMCPAQMCGAVPFSIKPIDEEGIEPMGTQRCTQRQVEENGVYVWRQLCE